MNSGNSTKSRYALLCGLAATALLALIALLRTFMPDSEPAGPGGWLTGNPQRKFDRLAYHQRGLDQAMWEVGYRFRELAWAGAQQDWNYARYQLDKVRLTLEQAIERRPARSKNARLFLKEGVEPLRQVLENNPGDDFAAHLQQFLAACNSCHAREQAPLMPLNAWAARAPAAAEPEIGENHK